MADEFDDDDWYRDLQETPEDKRREAILSLIREALTAYGARPLRVRTLSVDFEARTISLDGRVYGPVETGGLSIPLISTERLIMPSRTTEPW